MAELREVFEMVTKQTEPDLDAWKQQEDRHRRTSRNRKVGAMALVAALIVGILGFVAFVLPGDGENSTPADPGRTTTEPDTAIPPLGAQIMDLDGVVMQEIPGMPEDAGALQLSPDGSSIAFVTSNGQIATIGVDGEGMRILTEGANTNDGDAQNAVSWSPDGTQIAYASSGDIYVMNADGSDVRRLTTDPDGDYEPAWSPDGSRIAYWNGSPTGQDGGPMDADIYTVPAIGGTPTAMTSDGIPSIAPTWSPNGARIAYFSTDGADIRVVQADGRGDRILFDGHGNQGWAPAWSPGGTKIAFLRCCTSTFPFPLLEVQVLDLARGTVRSLGINVHMDLNGPAWVSDDTLLVNRFD